MNITLDRREIPALPELTSLSPEHERLLVEPEAKSEPRAPSTNGKIPITLAPKRQNRRVRAFLGLGALAAGLAIGTYYFHFIAPYESTDDAFIEAHVTAIAPQVAGRVVSLLVNDNQPVRQGDALLQIDPRDYQVKLDQAQAGLAAAKSRLEQAKAQSAVDQAKAEQEQAGVTAAEAEASRAQADFKRYEAVESRAVSRSQIDLAETQARSSTAQVDVARNKARAAEAQVGLDKANIETAAADVRQGEAGVRQAELDLSYTRVTALEDGFVTRRTVEPGAYVQTGQALLAIVPREVWVIANFKETQLRHMRPGQPVEIRVDAYPQYKFKGHLDSIQAGSGARFSLLPPENASGNYVKVVQRVPVKIVFDDASDAGRRLGPGMSVVPEVRVK